MDDTLNQNEPRMSDMQRNASEMPATHFKLGMSNDRYDDDDSPIAVDKH